MGVCLVREQPEGVLAGVVGLALGVVGAEQRDELGIVSGLHGDRARGLVGRSVNLRGEPPTGASQRVIGGLGREIFVIRFRPL
jgi:hypothetical protein